MQMQVFLSEDVSDEGYMATGVQVAVLFSYTKVDDVRCCIETNRVPWQCFEA